MAKATAAPDVKRAYGRKKKRKATMTLADINTSADSTRAMGQLKARYAKELRNVNAVRRKSGSSTFTPSEIKAQSEYAAKHSLRGRDYQERIHRKLEHERSKGKK